SFELVWQGRFHYGDQPGVYGDAAYVGLASEWPLTVRKFDRAPGPDGEGTLRLTATDVKIYGQYPGHRVTVSRWVPDIPGNPLTWRRVQLGPTFRLTSGQLDATVALPGDAAAAWLSVRIEVDDTMHPGLFDEFVVTRLELASGTHYASFGF